MSDFLEAARKIEAALELMRQAPLAIEQETMQISCFCAVHDEPYTVYFTKQPNGMFRFKESVKVLRDKRSGARTFGRVPAQLQINVDLFERTNFPCAWCGNGNLNYCKDDCGQLVCGGMTVGNRFTCRKSCGASWVGIPLDELPAQAGSPGSRPMVKPSSVRQPPPTASVVSNSLRLGSGTDLVKKNNR